jgi:uncharacterized protein
MPMPHRTQMEIIKRRLVGKDGRERTRALREILAQLPGYKNGPYADVRKWVTQELERTRVRSGVVHRDVISVRREGAAQIALVGAPNAGKSSLLHTLSDVQIKIGDYAFTTVKPVPALTRIGGALVQFVEIPGLIRGAHEGRGGGRALLSVLREADAIVFCHDANAPLSSLEEIRIEVRAASIELPAMLAVTKVDEAPPGAFDAIAVEVDLPAIGVSVLDDDSLDVFRERAWELTGSVRVFTRRGSETATEPIALPSGSTVRDVAYGLHKHLAETFTAARVWGPSARFPGQRVGGEHVVADGDSVEILAER